MRFFSEISKQTIDLLTCSNCAFCAWRQTGSSSRESCGSMYLFTPNSCRAAQFERQAHVPVAEHLFLQPVFAKLVSQLALAALLHARLYRVAVEFENKANSFERGKFDSPLLLLRDLFSSGPPLSLHAPGIPASSISGSCSSSDYFSVPPLAHLPVRRKGAYFSQNIHLLPHIMRRAQEAREA